MPPRTSESIAQRVSRRIKWAIRDRLPLRPVRRTVQGVAMVLPWSHRLPDYARIEPGYGQNLPMLAAALVDRDGRPIMTVDVGANVGDSALQILAAAPGRIPCVEGDQAFLKFLHLNVDEIPEVCIEPSLLLPHSGDLSMAPVRVGGTTRFEPGESNSTMPTITTFEWCFRHPDFERVRLVKSDTDGHDVALIPAMARTWADAKPVLFFEYDHELTRLAGLDPAPVWRDLAAFGYRQVRVWNNAGRPIGTYPIDEMPARSAPLDGPRKQRASHYWDVAVVHGDDEAGRLAVRDVLPADPI